jgi:anti-sigma factor RsiW
MVSIDDASDKSNIPLTSDDFDMIESLSAYLDGELSYSEEAAVRDKLATSAEWMACYHKLPAAQALFQQATIFSANDDDSSELWKAIAPQLGDVSAQDDAVVLTPELTDTLEPNVEFLSAYYDGELPRTSLEVAAFEAQLLNLAAHNLLLSHWSAITDLYSQFIQRLERACPFDATDSVMQQLVQDAAAQEPPAASDSNVIPFPVSAIAPADGLDNQDDGADLTEWSVLASAYTDNELDAKESLMVAKRLESDAVLRDAIQSFTSLSDQIHRVTIQIEAQAPNLWPRLEPVVAAELAAQAKPSFVPRKWVSMASAAAVIALVIMVLPGTSDMLVSSLQTPPASQTNAALEKASLSKSPSSAAKVDKQLLGSATIPTAEEYLMHMTHRDIPSDAYMAIVHDTY